MRTTSQSQPGIKFDDGKYTLSEDYIKALEQGAAFEALAQSAAYKVLLDRLEDRANDALRVLKGASLSSDDRLKANLLLKYECAEEALRDVQIFVQEAVAERRRILSEISDYVTDFDVIDFGGNNE